jgi:lipopolysaccharide transport protein LptA
VSGRVHGFTLWLLLCPLAAAAEPTLQDVAAPVQSKLEKALPDSLHGEARSAARQLGVDEGSTDGPFSLGDFDRRAPVVIQAGELEATDRDDRRVLVFRRNVEVKQGTLQLTAGELSAVYPSGSSQPSRLEAKGGVVVREGTREARCERVVYDRPARRLDCFGKASMQDGNDRIEGTSIGFDLARRSVAVGGGTEVVFEPRSLQTNEQGQLELPSGLPLLHERAPAHVRALNLDASDGPEGRRIAFDGDVTLSQEGTTLRAQRLEAVYPPGADQPDRLIATGEVSLEEGIRQASCERAEYLRLENRVLCEGGVARAGDDRLEGDTIDFALGEEKLSVRGRTRLVLGPREPEEKRSATP